MDTAGYTLFFQGDYMGLKGPDGQVVVPPLYDLVAEPSDGRVYVQQNGQHGYCDLSGSMVIPLQSLYAVYGPFQEGYAPVQAVNGLWGFIDLNGNEAITPQFRDVAGFSDGLAVVAKSGGLWGAIDGAGGTVIDFQFPVLQSFCEGYAVFGHQHALGLLNKKGEIVLPQKSFYVGNVTQGEAVVKLEEEGEFKEGVFHVQDGTITWNDGMDIWNELQVAYKQLASQFHQKLGECYRPGSCACAFPRIRGFVQWQGPATFRGSGTAVSGVAKFFGAAK